MAFRIGDFVVYGEINNTRRNTVSGWLDFGNGAGVRIDLAGNLIGELAGKHLRFEAPPRALDDDPQRQDLDKLQTMQIGVIGDVQFRMVRLPIGSIEEFYERTKRGESPPEEQKPCLYLEWYSQNGRIVAEIVDPQITYDPVDENEQGDDDEFTPDPIPDAEDTKFSASGYRQNDEGEYEEVSYSSDEDEEEDDDPFNLFPPDFAAQVQEWSGDAPQPDGPRNWDEVIPGIDEETKKMYESWDEVTYGTKDEPLSTLFDPPIALKPPEEIADEDEAMAELTPLLARLALHCVAIDLCVHFSALDTYHWLLKDILPKVKIHPDLASTGFVQHFSTWESCPQCEAEFEAEYQQFDDSE